MSNRGKGVVPKAINREVSMSTILNQLPELNERQLMMVGDYIRGLTAADRFLSR